MDVPVQPSVSVAAVDGKPLGERNLHPILHGYRLPFLFVVPKAMQYNNYLSCVTYCKYSRNYFKDTGGTRAVV